MDEFIGKVKEQASKAKSEAVNLGKRVYDKTNTAISIGKISFAISETESKIKDEYAAIGKTIYEKYLEKGGDVCDCVKAGCEAIDALYAEKMTLKEKKAELKESVTCSNCGEFNKKTASYCSKCGSKLEEEPEIEYEANAGEAEDDSNEDYTSYVDTTPSGSKVSDVKEKIEGTADKVKDAVEDAIPDEIKEKAEDVKDKIEEKVRKVIKIRAKKPDED
ncbi:MAG: hypothetical protein Q4G33_07265 [bacterium]|nr:hypothetical protein [bacterium]